MSASGKGCIRDVSTVYLPRLDRPDGEIVGLVMDKKEGFIWIGAISDTNTGDCCRRWRLSDSSGASILIDDPNAPI